MLGSERMEIQPKLSDTLIAQLRNRWLTQTGQDALHRFLLSLKAHPLDWKRELRTPDAPSVPANYPDLLTDLRGIELHNIDLPGAQLPYVDLSYAVIGECDLKGVCLQGSKLSHASFKHCNLKHSDLLQVMADHSLFEHCLMNQAVLGNGDFRESLFLDVQLPGAILDSADISGSKMNKVNIEGAHTLFTKFPKGFTRNKGFPGPHGPRDPSPF